MELEHLGAHRPSLDALTLKLIALVTMTIDHTAVVLGCGALYPSMRMIGRIAFPIYCFLLVEGYFHTKNIQKYAARLAVMAVVSELPFDLMSDGFFPSVYSQSVMLTLLLGLTAVALLDWGRRQAAQRTEKPLLRSVLFALYALPLMYLFMKLGNWLEVDYHGGGVLLIIVFYLLRKRFIPLFVVVSCLLYYYFGSIEMTGLLAFLPIALYNGQRGHIPAGKAGQWFFYWYYPLHICALVLIAAVFGVQSYSFF